MYVYKNFFFVCEIILKDTHGVKGVFMRMQHMEVLCFNLSVAKKTLVMLFPTLIAVNRSTDCRLCLYFRHICTDTHRQNVEEKKKKQVQHVSEVGHHPCVALPMCSISATATEAGALCISVPWKIKKEHNVCTLRVCVDYECVRVCVCLLSVWESVCSQVPAMGLCGCGWWLACLHCRQLRRNCLFFPVFLSACV